MRNGTHTERQSARSPRRGLLVLLFATALLATCLLLAAAAQAIGSPSVTSTSFTTVLDTIATLQAKVNPNNRPVTDAHFQYISQADWEADGEAFGAGTLETAPQTIARSEAPQPISAVVEGLSPRTKYRLRAYAHSKAGTVVGPGEATFITLSSPQSFGPCPNDPFRSGVFASLGDPSAKLPDCRAYEQASPVDKNGNNVLGSPRFIKAAVDGSAITFQSAFGIPGGVGGQSLPTYVGSFEGDGWSTSGLLPPGSAGQRGKILGWLPDFSVAFAVAQDVASETEAIFELRPGGAAPTRITPYEPKPASFENGIYGYAGASADGDTVIFEAGAALPAEEGQQPLPGSATNVYAWDANSGRFSLASAMNTEAESEAELPRGAFAGPYDWGRGIGSLGALGGVQGFYYLQDTHAVAADGSVFFTAAGSGQLYERINPTEPQSALNEAGECTQPDKACTFHISASEKKNGLGSDGADGAGPQPAAFMAATEDGKEVLFTSPEKLTDDANTGHEQPPAQIGRAIPGATEAEEVEGGFIPAHALGLTVSPDGSYLYWANPTDHSIGRAKLNGAGQATQIQFNFIVPGETECESRPDEEPGVLQSSPARPRYVAVDSEHVYWTNTGPLGEGGFTGATDKPVRSCGTIGRAKLDSEANLIPGSVDPEFIAGASNPQGIAANSEHLYWGNGFAGPFSDPGPSETIGRAALNGDGAASEVNQKFVGAEQHAPQALTLTESYLYFASAGQNSYVSRVPLGGGSEESIWLGGNQLHEGHPGVRGLAVIGEYVYWAANEEAAIGRVPLAEIGSGECFNPESKPGCEREYLKLPAGPFGLASDGSHLYWSVNGEAPSNPGNDLYRYSAQADAEGHHLADLTLTPEPTANGAEVLGVLGASKDGAFIYFAANAPLAPGAQAGDCHTNGAHGIFSFLSGHCGLYLDHEGTIEYLAQLHATGTRVGNDALNWIPSAEGLFSQSENPKTAALSADGRTLLITSMEQLTDYPNHGTPELYRHQVGVPGFVCVSCNPSGQAPSEEPGLGTRKLFPIVGPVPRTLAALPTRFLSASGNRVFFETSEALVGADTDGQAGCPNLFGGNGGNLPACLDVYEWEAPGSGSCTPESPAYSPQNEGCFYLLSPGGEEVAPATLFDADAEGENVFISTPARLVGQDTDSLRDVYDARVGGGLEGQNPLPPKECEGEGCKGGASAAPELASPTTPNFKGPGNVREKPRSRCPKGKRQVRRKGKARCVKPRHSKHHHRRHKQADANRRTHQ